MDALLAADFLDGWPNVGPPSEILTTIATRGIHVCGLRPDRAIVCWGENRSGETMFLAAQPLPLLHANTSLPSRELLQRGAFSLSCQSMTVLRHRGRGKLAEPEPGDPRTPPSAALDAFCRAFNARDLSPLTAVLLDTVAVEMPGCAVDLDLATTTDPRAGILYHTVLSPISAGTPARYLAGYTGGLARAEPITHLGETIVLLWYPHDTGESVRCLMRFDTADSGRFARVRIYYFSPELLTDVAGELGLPLRTNGRGLD